jgi:hypothetical protein
VRASGERRANVHFHDFEEFGRRQILQVRHRRAAEYGCVVHQHVDAAEPGDGVADELSHAVIVRYVNRADEHVRAAAQFAGEFAQRYFTARR